MNQKKKKRYLVTYTDQDVDSSKASSILGVTKSKTKEGRSLSIIKIIYERTK